jgi:hypothetical protein
MAKEVEINPALRLPADAATQQLRVKHAGALDVMNGKREVKGWCAHGSQYRAQALRGKGPRDSQYPWFALLDGDNMAYHWSEHLELSSLEVMKEHLLADYDPRAQRGEGMSQFGRLLLGSALALTLSCAEDTGVAAPPDTALTDMDVPDTSTPDVSEPECCGSVQGRVVTIEGDPLAGAYVLVCNADYCVSGETGIDGQYDVGQLTLVEYKIKVQGSQLGYANMLFFQDLPIKDVVTAPRDLVAVESTEDMQSWVPDDGGTVTLAGGMLELSVDPGALKYPLGVPKEVLAVSVPIDALPPYDQEPWIGSETGAFAFFINPVGVKTLEGVFSFRVLGANAAADATYSVWTVDDKTAHMEPVGNATADAEGNIVSDADCGMKLLSTLLILPE